MKKLNLLYFNMFLFLPLSLYSGIDLQLLKTLENLSVGTNLVVNLLPNVFEF
jgi:hypothetical protein